jgi:hypothetical protein
MIRRLIDVANLFALHFSNFHFHHPNRRIRSSRRLRFLTLEERVLFDASGQLVDPAFEAWRAVYAEPPLAIASAHASGRTFYVDLGHSFSSDGNSGSESSPWRTLRHAANVAVAGDTILVKGGTYVESSAYDNWATATLNPVNSGTSSEPITFRAYAGETVLVTNDTSNLPALGTSGRDYIVWEGFVTDRRVAIFDSVGSALGFTEVIGQYEATTDNHDGVRIERSSEILVHHNAIHGVRGESSNSAGIKVYTSDHLVIEDNYLYDNTTGIFDKDSGFANTYRRNLATGNSTAFQGNNQGQDATYSIYDNVFSGMVQLLIKNDGSEIHNNLFLSDIMAGTWVPDSDTLTGIQLWDNVLVSSASSAQAWQQGWAWTGNEFGYFDHNVYTTTPTYNVKYQSARSLADMRNLGYEQNSSVVSNVSAVYSGAWELLAPWQTAGRYGGAVGPDNVAQVLDTARYGPGAEATALAAVDAALLTLASTDLNTLASDEVIRESLDPLAASDISAPVAEDDAARFLSQRIERRSWQPLWAP